MRLFALDPAAAREARSTLRERASEPWEKKLAEIAEKDLDHPSRKWPQAEPLKAVFPEMSNEFVNRRLAGQNPFPFTRAEHDLHHLFHKKHPAYWSDHDLYRQLKSSDRLWLVYGPPGSGRTAMALALSRYSTEQDRLAVYLPGNVKSASIQRAFAGTLLDDFIKQHPTYLAKLSLAERRLLARYLSSALSREIVCAELAATRRNSNQMEKWLNETKIERQKNYWKETAVLNLELLEREVDQLPATSDVPWPDSLRPVASAFGFSRLVLAIDVQADGVPQLEESILPHLQSWSAAGLQTIIFTPRQPAGRPWAAARVEATSLKWNADQLTGLARYRYKQLVALPGSRPRSLLADVILDDALQQLVRYSLQSGEQLHRFIELWNNMIAQIDADTEQITSAHVKQVIENDPDA
jgi:hypothetical protein